MIFVIILFFEDRASLKVTNDFKVRQNIHNYLEYNPKCWP